MLALCHQTERAPHTYVTNGALYSLVKRTFSITKFIQLTVKDRVLDSRLAFILKPVFFLCEVLME